MAAGAAAAARGVEVGVAVGADAGLVMTAIVAVLAAGFVVVEAMVARKNHALVNARLPWVTAGV